MADLRATLPLQREERRGDVITTQGQAIRTVSRVTRLRWPGGILEWRRPVAVEVHSDGGVRRIPIRDMSRVIALALLALGFGVSVGTARWLRRRTSDETRGEL